MAEEEVQALLGSLPNTIRKKARSLPIMFERHPGGALLAEGLEPDTLGLFQGPSLMDDPSDPLPSSIILYLDNIWDVADNDTVFFREEVRTTLLHELGHYFGWDETDLETRDLD